MDKNEFRKILYQMAKNTDTTESCNGDKCTEVAREMIAIIEMFDHCPHCGHTLIKLFDE